MEIYGIPAFNDNYIWAIINKSNKTFSCVDPGTAEPVLRYAKKKSLTLTDILITHHHNDHTGGVIDLVQYDPKIRVYGPLDPRVSAITNSVQEEDQITIDDYLFRIKQIPGHTSTHICYLESSKKWLFCGDTLFSAGCGRVFDGTIEQLHQSINFLKSLPGDTKIYCGHEYTLQNLQFAAYVEPDNTNIAEYYLDLTLNPVSCTLPSTIALEKKINPFLRTDKPSVINFAKEHGISSLDSLSIFKLLREKKNSFPVTI